MRVSPVQFGGYPPRSVVYILLIDAPISAKGDREIQREQLGNSDRQQKGGVHTD